MLDTYYYSVVYTSRSIWIRHKIYTSLSFSTTSCDKDVGIPRVAGFETIKITEIQ